MTQGLLAYFFVFLNEVLAGGQKSVPLPSKTAIFAGSVPNFCPPTSTSGSSSMDFLADVSVAGLSFDAFDKGRCVGGRGMPTGLE